ncbi:flagellar modification protein B [Paraphotobacterium marinum]|uniref:Flagellar modification protein B n=1 Tax=Paraphotobacterium marinum TaxID=1755811 RepID=A0A220VCT4_9GAMM|nr:acylneuraminate cytidylyltransferase family protein [Paraphotobacterium marinum]ASK78110.1 flagellar modification protein B [Paraphotobacterium marinum]
MIENSKEILCTICARGGSKGVKNKNIRELSGKPLIAHSIQRAKDSKLFEHIVVSTDSDEIAEISIKYGAEVFFKRDDDLASDTAGKVPVIRDAFIRSESHFSKKFDTLIDLDATSPLRTVEDIINSLELFEREGFDNLFSVMPSRKSPYFNLVEEDKDGRVNLSKPLDETVLRRQDAPKTYDINGSIYIWKRDIILKEDSLFLDKTGLYVMPEERSIDIDTAVDFKFVEFLMRDN